MEKTFAQSALVTIRRQAIVGDILAIEGRDPVTLERPANLRKRIAGQHPPRPKT